MFSKVFEMFKRSDMVSTTHVTDSMINQNPEKETQVSRNLYSAFLNLPTEILVQIFQEMDPVTRICLGLTCRSLYILLLETINKDMETWGRPFDWFLQLDMQVSIEGRVKNWWWHDEITGYNTTCDLVHNQPLLGWVIDWLYSGKWSPQHSTSCQGQLLFHPSLGELIEKEKLFDGLWHCGGCSKFKPEEAYRPTELENASLKNLGSFWHVDKQTLDNFWANCRRCRTAQILVHEMGFKGYVQVYDDFPREVTDTETLVHSYKRETLGLRNVWQNPEVPISETIYFAKRNCFHKWSNEDCNCIAEVINLRTRDPVWFLEVCKSEERRYDAYVGNYTLWEDIFEEFGI